MCKAVAMLEFRGCCSFLASFDLALLTIFLLQMANPGFAFDYQFIDVPDYLGAGETEPTPYFYQNLGEAEFVVRLYQFMRLIGYPARKISILTTYNGQKHLLRDVINQRCVGNPAFGRPYKVRIRLNEIGGSSFSSLSLFCIELSPKAAIRWPCRNQ